MTVSYQSNEIVGDISGATPLGLKGSAVDGASAVAVQLGSRNTLADAGAKLLSITNCGVEKLYVLANGQIVGAMGANFGGQTVTAAFSTTAAISVSSADGGAAGDSATINQPAGTFTKDATGTTFTLTNSLIVTGVKVFAQINTADATATGITSIVIDTAAHTAVFTFNAQPTASTVVSFFLLKFV